MVLPEGLRIGGSALNLRSSDPLNLKAGLLNSELLVSSRGSIARPSENPIIRPSAQMHHASAPSGNNGMRAWLYHPSGNQFFRKLARALHEAGCLEEVGTSIDWRERPWMMTRFWPKGLRAELGRRAFSRELGVGFATAPWRESVRLAAMRLGWKALYHPPAKAFSVERVYAAFDQRMASRLRARTGGVVYAYEDSALACFQAARKLGLKTAYDLPIAYCRLSQRLIREESERLPAWAPTLELDAERKLQNKEAEIALADMVICPSRFVVESLPTSIRQRARVVLAPFGSPEVRPALSPPSSVLSNGVAPGRKLRVLFAGSMGQRKGLGDLFAAMKLLQRSDVELVVMGLTMAPMEFYRREYPNFVYEPGRPHAQVLELMRSCDVFCLPSIVEGRALVIQEAMSQGLPVIITPNTGADDVIAEGLNGFVVPIRSPEKIAGKLAWFADNRAGIPAMGEAARLAAAKVTWKVYGETIIENLKELVR